MPRKIRQLEADLIQAGYVNKGGKGSHRNYKHPVTGHSVTISGKGGDDAQRYQENEVKKALGKTRA